VETAPRKRPDRLPPPARKSPQRLRSLVASSETIITILTDATAIDAATRKDGLLAGDVAGKLFIEMSTVRPETESALAAPSKKSAIMVECPGRRTVVPQGRKLFGFVGGRRDFARARPLLETDVQAHRATSSRRRRRKHEARDHLPLPRVLAGIGEALALCRSLGLDSARIVDIFADTSGGPNVLKDARPPHCALQGKMWARSPSTSTRCART